MRQASFHVFRGVPTTKQAWRRKRVGGLGAALALLFLWTSVVWASPARAFEYTVEGVAPRRVVVDDELFSAGVAAAAVGYAIPLLMGGLFFASASLDGTPASQHNSAVGFALSAPPVVGGVLLGAHVLDTQEAYDSREGWAALPALAAWAGTAAQVVGLALIGGAFLAAERVPVGE